MTFFLLPCSSDTLEIQINNISKGGILHLAVYDSKEVFESDRGDQPGPQPGIVAGIVKEVSTGVFTCLLYTSPSPRDMRRSRMPSSA